MKLAAVFQIKVILLLAVSLSCGISHGQNLVPNPDFELYHGCPDYYAQMDSAIGWGVPENYLASSDYFNSCASPISVVSVPVNAFGNQAAASGSAYAGLYAFSLTSSSIGYREYIQSKLTEPLKPNRAYRVRLKYALAEYSSVESYGHFGVHFSEQGAVGTLPQGPEGGIKVNTHLKATKPLTDTDTWVTLEWKYIARGSEEYITIGNFENDSVSLIGVPTSIRRPRAYVYVDDVEVSLVNCNTPIYTELGDTSLCPGESIVISPPTNGEHFNWLASPEVSTLTITEAGSYVAEIYNECDNSVVDTLMVSMIECPPKLKMPNIFSPNNDGINDYFEPIKADQIFDFQIQIANRWGQIVFNGNSLEGSWNGDCKGAPCSEGTYFWVASIKGFEGKESIEKGFVELIR